MREGTRLPHVVRAIAAELLSLPERPTAVFAASDTQAIGVLEAARAQRTFAGRGGECSLRDGEANS